MTTIPLTTVLMALISVDKLKTKTGTAQMKSVTSNVKATNNKSGGTIMTETKTHLSMKVLSNNKYLMIWRK